MIRAPWWTYLLACGIGALGMALWLRAGSDTGLEELRAAAARESARADSIAELVRYHVQRADSATEAHAALAAASDSTIARLTARVQATTARAADLGDQLRAILDEDGSAVLAELESEWRSALDAERAQASVWQARALSAEAGWADERLARAAAQQESVALRAQLQVQLSIDRTLRDSLRRAERRGKVDRVIAVAGAGKVCYDSSKEGHTGIAIGSCGAALYAITGGV